MSWDSKLNQIQSDLNWIIHALQVIYSKELKIMASLDDVLADVAEEDTLADSLVTLLHGIKQQLDDALSGATLPAAAQAKVDAIFSKAESSKTKMADAVTANTPVETQPAGGGVDTTVGGGGTDTTVGGGGADTTVGGGGTDTPSVV